jgi:hypothetical protein
MALYFTLVAPFWKDLNTHRVLIWGSTLVICGFIFAFSENRAARFPGRRRGSRAGSSNGRVRALLQESSNVPPIVVLELARHYFRQCGGLVWSPIQSQMGIRMDLDDIN